MKITDITMGMVRVPVTRLEDGGIAPYRGSRDKVGTTEAMSCVFRVSTDEGIVGWGEMNPIINYDVTRSLVDDYIKPSVIGTDPFERNAVMSRFGVVYNPQVNTRSFLTGVEMAIWDIVGKALNRPVYELLGGKVRDDVRIAYCVGMLGVEETARKITQVRDEGFTCFKTKGGKNVDRDIRTTIAMRDAIGGDFGIRMDMNQGYDMVQAIHYIDGVEGCRLEYVEQPLAVNNLDGTRSLRGRGKTPVGINEDCYIPGNLYRAIKMDAIDCGIVDLEPLGGIGALTRPASIAEEAGIPLAHHCGWDMGIKLAAILHAVSAFPAFSLPIDSTYMAHTDDVLAERIDVRNGAFQAPDGPGLGVVVDEKKVAALAVEPLR
ncbi:MAG: mandelate racemase/muconate lactonizing enzyme family protein [Spirochaetales bacterium]|nr:mandelate racemase/muconate lactonizing enzyme family protein [Spirochaetales bacterium]